MKEQHLVRDNWFYYVIGTFIDTHENRYVFMSTSGRNQFRKHVFDIHGQSMVFFLTFAQQMVPLEEEHYRRWKSEDSDLKGKVFIPRKVSIPTPTQKLFLGLKGSLKLVLVTQGVMLGC